jgi:hypothetical protein
MCKNTTEISRMLNTKFRIVEREGDGEASQIIVTVYFFMWLPDSCELFFKLNVLYKYSFVTFNFVTQPHMLTIKGLKYNKK